MKDVLTADVHLYVVKSGNGEYFAGFDSINKKQIFTADPTRAKKFTNKFDIKLRPDEMLVEMIIDLDKYDVSISPPFRPQKRKAIIK